LLPPRSRREARSRPTRCWPRARSAATAHPYIETERTLRVTFFAVGEQGGSDARPVRKGHIHADRMSDQRPTWEGTRSTRPEGHRAFTDHHDGASRAGVRARGVRDGRRGLVVVSGKRLFCRENGLEPGIRAIRAAMGSSALWPVGMLGHTECYRRLRARRIACAGRCFDASRSPSTAPSRSEGRAARCSPLRGSRGRGRSPHAVGAPSCGSGCTEARYRRRAGAASSTCGGAGSAACAPDGLAALGPDVAAANRRTRSDRRRRGNGGRAVVAPP
jgi:hypothetical protein